MKHTAFFILNRIDKTVIKALEWLCIVLFAAITVLLSLNICVRFAAGYLPGFSLSMHWFDEILELLYAALIFYGAAAVWVTNSHFRVGDWLSKYLKGIPARFAYRLLVEGLSLLFIVVFFKYALDLTMTTEEQTTAFAMPKSILYACMPISSAIMIVYSIKNLCLDLLKIVKPSLNFDDGKEDLNH